MNRLNLKAFVFITIFLSAAPAFACFVPVSPFNPAELGGFFILLGGLVYLSISDYKHLIRDLILFVVAVVVAGYYMLGMRIDTQAVFMGFMAGFTMVYIIRVTAKANENTKFYWLFTAVPFLLFVTLNAPPPFEKCWCPTRCKSRLMNIGTSLEMYYTDNEFYLDSLNSLSPSYLREIPVCKPSVENIEKPEMAIYRNRLNLVDTPYKYEVNDNRDNYTINCQSDNHRFFNIPEGFPQYGGNEGLIDRP